MSDKNVIDSLFDRSGDVEYKKRTVSEKLRLILPLIAVLLMGLLVLSPLINKDKNSFAFEITTPKKGEIEKLMVDELSYYVTDDENSVHNFVVDSIEEVDLENKITKLTNIDGIFNSGPSSWINLKSGLGYFYQKKNILKIPNIADLFYSNGMEISGVDVVVDLNESRTYSKQPVIGDGLLGAVNADGFEYDHQKDVLTFLGNVKIIKSEE